MTAPRLEIRLDRIRHNARWLVERLGRHGIAVTAVTKAAMGSPEVASALVGAGVVALGDSRIENIEAMRGAGIAAPMVLIRTPMLSQVERVVEHADVSLNTEPVVLEALSRAAGAQERTHGVVLMVELGDLREGILPGDLEAVVAEALRLPHLALRGIGTNLACQSGVAPDGRNMAELSALAGSLETTFGVKLATVSGGNSANLDWVLGDPDVGRVNDLRLGEAILLGREPLHRNRVEGLHGDAFTLVAEVIESKIKPTLAWGDVSETAFGVRAAQPDRGSTARAILAVGRQDVDPEGLEGPAGTTILGASSDHLVLDAGQEPPPVGSDVRFSLGYGALLAAMTSPFVTKVFTSDGGS